MVTLDRVEILLDKSNRLKEKELTLKKIELKQQMFFIELIEECLPIIDGKKRIIHQRCFNEMNRIWHEYDRGGELFV